MRTGTWRCLELPATNYTTSWELQHRLAAAKKDGAMDTDIIILLEHFPVFTLGRRGGRDNLTVSQEVLENAGIPIIHAERGGDITYHGPGQLVGYPVVNLKTSKLKVVDFVTRLEDVMLRTAADWNIPAERNSLNRGIWVGNSKMGSIGIAVRRSISFHGFALNVNLSLEPFTWINPCGLQGIGMTSMQQEIGGEISVSQVRNSLKHHLEKVFGISLIPTDLSDIQKILEAHSASEVT
ncbi:MAG: hypothetical protein B6245_13000 [Desulfobacteraceae bacterium 4572_88]|nr:MAG: hypothetical protein B6245_13000 [Desulfobacteraceae bacterium 4572_88]